MKPRTHLSPGIPAALFFAMLAAMPVWAQSYSHARIVRLSFVEGNVTLQRPDVQGWGEAPVNTPLEQGFKLSTGDSSFAELQFENGGTIRLGEQSYLELTRIGLDPNGLKITKVELRQGYATFHPVASLQEESFQVSTPIGQLTAQGAAEFRVDLEQGMERVEVTDGSVDEQSNLGPMNIEKDSVLVMQPGAAEPIVVSQGITQDDWDQWVADREAHGEMSNQGPSPDNYTGDADGTPYGWSDLAQNGTWTDIEGEGEGWTPNVAGGGWSPYSSGQWCWYPGSGFTWIASEPWGWLPYHYGSWEFVPGTGWVWFPGSLRNWSPSQVTWYQGSNWVGWVPRPHRKGSVSDCTSNCGGGAVSTATFRSGGLLTPTRMLGINPTTGTAVSAPGINPSQAALLPGAMTSLPASQMQGYQGNGQPGVGVAGAANGSFGSQRIGSANSNSNIVYDPQQGGYVNNTRNTTTPRVQPAFPNSTVGGNTVTPAGGNPGWTQPVPVEGRQQNPGTFDQPRQAPYSPNYASSGPRTSGGTTPAGTGHGGGWAPAESHTSSAPASSGGGHSAPSGGGGGGGGGGGHHR